MSDRILNNKKKTYFWLYFDIIYLGPLCTTIFCQYYDHNDQPPVLLSIICTLIM